jgi:trans-aconitate 2-methyltransferase
LIYQNRGSWDARTYDQVSRLVQYRWGQRVIKWRKWRGDEIVIDAGCGTGQLTRQLAKQVPRGKVYGVDIDSNMIKQAKKNLKSFDNVEIIQSSFTDVKLPRKVDVVFSNAALHWVLDHRKAFQNFWEMLKTMEDSSGSNGSQLLIQCGGYGNLQQTITVLERIAHSDSFKAYFVNWKQPWYFAKPDDTDALLQEIGYTDRTTYLHSDRVFFSNRRIYAKFIKTVVMKPYLQHLAVDKEGCKLKTLFLDLFLDEVEKCTNRSKTRWSLDYVRLNIISYRKL